MRHGKDRLNIRSPVESRESSEGRSCSRFVSRADPSCLIASLLAIRVLSAGLISPLPPPPLPPPIHRGARADARSPSRFILLKSQFFFVLLLLSPPREKILLLTMFKSYLFCKANTVYIIISMYVRDPSYTMCPRHLVLYVWLFLFRICMRTAWFYE